MLAFGISSGIVALQEYIDDSIRTPNQLKELANIPVFSTISYIESEEEKRQRRLKNLIWAAVTLSGIGIFLFLIDQYVIKLEHAWEIVVERIMLLA
jgi:hypothetical protein